MHRVIRALVDCWQWIAFTAANVVDFPDLLGSEIAHAETLEAALLVQRSECTALLLERNRGIWSVNVVDVDFLLL